MHDLSDQQKQTHHDFDRLKEENSELWKQVSNLRKKHDKQQDTVQRLITFMIHFIQQSSNSVSPITCTITCHVLFTFLIREHRGRQLEQNDQMMGPH